MAAVLLRAVARICVVDVGAQPRFRLEATLWYWLIAMSLELLRREKAP